MDEPNMEPRFGNFNEGGPGPDAFPNQFPNPRPFPDMPGGFPPNMGGPMPQIDPSKEIWVETHTNEGKPYYYHSITRETVWKRPTDNVQIIQQNEAQHLAMMSGGMPMQGARMMNPMDAGPMGDDMMPPNKMPDSSMMPVVMMPPPISVIPPIRGLLPTPLPAVMPMPNILPPPVDLRPPAAEWREHHAPDGRKYYYNIRTMETTWNKPPDLNNDGMTTNSSDEKENENVENEEKAKELSPQKPALTENQKRQRPVANEAVPGTPWCIVWTGDDKVFFYNPTTKQSLWTKPDDLAGRSDVETLLSDPPFKRRKKILGGIAQKQGGETEKSSAADEDEPVAKKSKTDEEDKSECAEENVAMTSEMKFAKFKELLRELQVSAFSTWEKELPRLVFDKRYTLLGGKDRKLAFDEYTRGRAEEERKERKQALVKAKEEFKALLAESKISNKTTFSEFAGRHGRDPRFKAIEKMRERENLFHEFVSENKNKKIQESKDQQTKLRNDYMELLAEKKCEKYSKWSHAKEKISLDSRYAELNPTLREQLYEEYYKAKREAKKSEKKHSAAPGDDKQRRMEESLKAREEQVEREKAERSREIDSERQKYRFDEAKQHFKALLADMVKSSDQSWNETKRLLKKDHRWALVGLLNQEDKERYFEEHIELLRKKKRNEFRQLLTETTGIKLTSSWKEVRKLIKNDARYAKFSSSDRKREREYEDFLKTKRAQAETDFLQLLQETKLITHKTRSTMKSNPQHFKDILAILREDQRYLVMKPFQDLRSELIHNYIDDLYRRGSPPPPTASDNTRRGAPKP